MNDYLGFRKIVLFSQKPKASRHLFIQRWGQFCVKLFFARDFLTASNSTNCGIENKCLKGWQQTKIMADFSVLLRRNLRTWDLRLQKLSTLMSIGLLSLILNAAFRNAAFKIILFHRKRANTQLPMLKVLLLFQYSDKKITFTKIELTYKDD